MTLQHLQLGDFTPALCVLALHYAKSSSRLSAFVKPGNCGRQPPRVIYAAGTCMLQCAQCQTVLTMHCVMHHNASDTTLLA
jgi:hypothetical protein